MRRSRSGGGAVGSHSTKGCRLVSHPKVGLQTTPNNPFEILNNPLEISDPVIELLEQQILPPTAEKKQWRGGPSWLPNWNLLLPFLRRNSKKETPEKLRIFKG